MKRCVVITPRDTLGIALLLTVYFHKRGEIQQKKILSVLRIPKERIISVMLIQ
jgi:hypothetical protein